MPRLSLSDTLNDSYNRLFQVLKTHDGDDYIIASLINISALMGLLLTQVQHFLLNLRLTLSK